MKPQPSAITYGSMTITPKAASDMLANAHNANRRISQSVVEKYAEEMKAGLWPENGQTLSFAPDKRVLNGHHRLWACIMADVPFTTGVALNVPLETFNTMDVGASKRTARDMIVIADGGIKFAPKNAGKIAAASLICLRYNSNSVMRRKPFTPREVQEYFDMHRGLEDYIAAACKGEVRQCAAPLGAVTYLASPRYRQRGFEFLDSLTTGANLGPGSPVLALRNRLVRNEDRLMPEERLGVIVLMWNAYIDGRSVTRTQLHRSDNFPKIKGATR